MTAHPDDAAAIHNLGPLKLDVVFPAKCEATLASESTRKIIAVLAESRAKQLLKDQAQFVRKLRDAATYYGSSFDGMFGLAADFIEAQAATLEAATARAEKAEQRQAQLEGRRDQEARP